MHRRDGSLALYVQNEAPESKKRANWLSALAGACFKLSQKLVDNPS
ncbi:DUF1214 domain-containing protein [Candidatus Poribacteria bacterium]|nr:DUF1214 domain-containing protein [Candidatus Poribacteria bacterium]